MSTEQNYQVLGKGDLTLDAFGNQVVVELLSLFHGVFTFDVPVSLFRAEINGVEENLITSTQVTSVNGALSVVTSGTIGEVVLVESRRHPRHQPNRSHTYCATVGIPIFNSNAVQDFGLFTTTNGAFFRCGIDGLLYACIMSGGVLTHEEKITLPSLFENSIDLSKVNQFNIQLNGDYFFYIKNHKTHRSELVHEIRMSGKSSVIPIENQALPAAYRVTSFGDTDGLISGYVDISSPGGTADREQYGENSSTRTVTAEVAADGAGGVVALLNPNLAPNGEINTRDLILARITVTADKKSVIKIYRTRDATAITGGLFAANAPGDFVQINTTFTALDYTKLQSFSTFRAAAGITIIKENPAKDTIDFYGIHGDYIVVACTEGVNVLADVSIEWGIEI